jgi:hypothetical protein
LSASASFASGESRAPTVPAIWIAVGGLFAVALATQLTFGMMADVGWLAHCDERWLDGAVPYRDFIEINPPASLLLYLPAVAAARAVGLRSELCIAAFGFLAAGAALALSFAALRRVLPGVAIAAVTALFVLPGETFCERDHLAAVFGVPLLALTLARVQGKRAPLWLALAAGVGAGMMAAIKPPYALVGVALALYLISRIGWRVVSRAPEYYAAAAVGLAYVAGVGLFFPTYVTDAMPLGVAVYVPAREGLAALLGSTGFILVLLIAVTAALTAQRPSPGFVIAMLATLAAGLGYFAQGKGWIYQAVPAAMFATLAGGFALDGRQPNYAALGAAFLTAGLAAPLTQNVGVALLGGLAIGLAVETAATRKFELDLARLAPAALAAAIGTTCGVCVIDRPPAPALGRMLATLGPHLAIGTISEDEGLGFPLVRRIGATWVMRANSLFVNAAADHLIAEHPDDAGLKARLQPFAETERRELVEDISRQRPDALLVGPTGTALHAEIWADPRVQAAMADYRRVATERAPGYTAQLWLRKDFAARP